LDSVSEHSELENGAKEVKNELRNGNRIKLERVAMTYCLPTNLADTFGTASLTILAKSQKPIGQIKCEWGF
jgi:hypothetical protein